MFNLKKKNVFAREQIGTIFVIIVKIRCPIKTEKFCVSQTKEGKTGTILN